jgi:hypothetical protein
MNDDGMAMENNTDPTLAPEQAQQKNTAAVGPQTIPSVSASGRRQAFQDLKRNLTEADLANPGTQKLILEILSNAEDARDEYKTYVDRYHEVNNRVGILTERLRRSILNEMMFNVGFGVGCAIIGLSTYFWNPLNAYGQICLAIGSILAVVFAVLRSVYVMKS